MGITRNNHYVPCMYLKRFESRPGWIFRYDLLVPNAGCPIWAEKPIDRVASATDLYTSLEDGDEVDTHERWLNREYETPAEEAIERAVTGKRMFKEHWRRLVRFVAAQDVRTPARLQEELERWRAVGPSLMESNLKESIEEFKAAHKAGRPPREPHGTVEPGFPLRVLIKPSDDDNMAEVRVESMVGRRLWIWGQRHVLNGIAEHLHQHEWTILVAPDDVTWSATDNPVIRLNFHHEHSYDFGGGWGSEGTEIFMPLDPKHMVYTRIGQKCVARGTVLASSAAKIFAKLIREHAFRHIFSPTQDESISRLRPRHVNLKAYKQEREEWSKWAREQADAELDMQRPLPGG
ncbi:Protein of unknown function [Granulicella rosea]|uniref:DUF4238 domain-containing protein n=1 Tax=Granulicella rosea TaxID=474952 RepID=A0A239E9X9_9BACT|nr:DUF4238 domain-containing protein [Granulicella rosea]SNS40833.1 Protein of unknown function [Granulicella rosea]